MDDILKKVSTLFRGPGGALAVLKDGEVVATKAYGYADLDKRIPFTKTTHVPICSISKQMVCLVMTDLLKNPTPAMTAKGGGDLKAMFDEELKRLLPKEVAGKVSLEQLYNMQSGIRDYWAMTTLWGAAPEDAFTLANDAPESLKRIRSFHFEPGTEFSYSNVNFHILGRILENVSGQSLSQLLAERVFIPAGMKTAALQPNTAGHPHPVVGYEGDESKRGYIPARNRLEWSGDAGVVATLEDMTAYEKYLDTTYPDTKSNYHVNSREQKYKDGTPARYGFGLGHSEVGGRKAIGHGGALRGFRLQRVHVPEERLSVVVLFNHEADPGEAAEYMIKKALQHEEMETKQVQAAKEWEGNFLDVETQLLFTVEKGEEDGEIVINHFGPERLKLTSPTTAESRSATAKIENDELHVQRLEDNHTVRARRIASPPQSSKSEPPSSIPSGYNGTYRSSDADSTMTISGDSGILYASFDGFLDKGPIFILRYVGEDIWAMACPRGLDAPGPGDWTVVFRREGEKVVGVRIGCWLARGVEYVKRDD